MTTTRLTPLANAAVRIATHNNAVGVFVAHGDGGTGWVRLSDGTEVQVSIDDLTMIATDTMHAAALTINDADRNAIRFCRAALTTELRRWIGDAPAEHATLDAWTLGRRIRLMIAEVARREPTDAERAERARELTAMLDRRHATGTDKHTLTAAAKDRLANAVRDTGYGKRRFIIDMSVANGWMEILPELLDTGMVTKGRSLNWDAPVWVLTDAGMHVRVNLLDNRVMRHLAEQARAELDGQALADIAKHLDEDAECGGHDDPVALQAGQFDDAGPLFCNGSCVEYIGPGADGFLRLFRHVATWSSQSGADLRQEVEQRLDWS